MNEKSAITGIINRDEDAINDIMNKYSRLLWPTAAAVLKNVGSEQDVEECIADVFIDLWQHPDRYDPEKGALKSWLCMVARCKAVDRYRVLSKHSTVPLEGAMMAGRMGIQDALLQEEAKKELIAAVNALDLSVKQIDNYLYRSKQKLRCYDLSHATESNSILQGLEEGVYSMEITAWVDSTYMSCQSVWSCIVTAGDAVWPSP